MGKAQDYLDQITITDKGAVEDRPISNTKPTYLEKVTQDIKNVAPGAARTGIEMAPALNTQASILPTLVRWTIANNPVWSDKKKQETLAEFDASYQATTGGQEKGPLSGLFGDYPNPFNIETIRKYVTDPLLGPGEETEAQTLPGAIVKRGLETGPSMFLGGPGGLLQKSVATGGAAVGGPFAREAASEFTDSKAWQNAADIAGSLVGGASPMLYNRIVNPNPVPPQRQPAVDYMKSKNVPLSVGQQTGNERLMRKEMMAGGTPATATQDEAFSAAAAREQGGFPKGTSTLTNETMKAELNRMGAEFDRLEGAVQPVTLGNRITSDLVGVVDDYKQNTPLIAPVVENVVNDIQANAARNGGFMSGEAFQSARSKIGKIVRESDDGQIKSALMKVQDLLDEAMSTGLSPEDQRAFRTVRAQYRNYLPIEFAKSGQGQAKREGMIDPQSLMTGIRNVEGRREVASGDRPLTQLAEKGGQTMVKPSSSGTAENLRAQLAGLLPLASGGLAGSLGMLGGGAGPLSTALGVGTAMVTAAAPKLRDAYISSETGQKIMGRNLAPRIGGFEGTDRGTLSALLAAARAAQLQEQRDQTRR